MMFFVVVLLVMVVGGAVLAGALGFGLFAHTESQRATAAKSAPQSLDDHFSSGADTITYDSRPASSLEAVTVIQGATQRGYELVYNDAGQLLFRRQSSRTT